tara:strand:+ start:419 stop:691 length:273 start_codon:yes stop_codon:yes gene_type:complete
MNLEKSLEIVISVIEESLEDNPKITQEMELLGGDLIDSMKLVEVCLSLEDKAEEMGFEFDWTSESALSKSKSMFRTISSLAEEFFSQSED